MRERSLHLFLIIICLNIYISANSQIDSVRVDSVTAVIDSLKNRGLVFNNDRKKPEIVLSTSQSVKFLRQRYQPQYWNDINDPFRVALGQLVFEASHAPYDSSAYVLKNYPYDSLFIPWDKFYIWEPMRLKIKSVSTAGQMVPVDSIAKSDTGTVAGADTVILLDSLPSVPVDSSFTVLLDSLFSVNADSVKTSEPTSVSDSLNTEKQNKSKSYSPFEPLTELKDTTIMVIIDTLHEVRSSRPGYPFRYLEYPYQSDSIGVAVNSLMKYLEERDSTVINFAGRGNNVTPVWLNSKSPKMIRYWLHNEFADSVTVWIGNPARDTIGLYLEQGINFRRPAKQGNYSDARVNVKALDNSKLLEVQKIVVKPQYWKYKTEASLILNQSALTNWVKGGENSISTALDVTGYADYNNKELKTSSNNFIRLQLGFQKSGTDDIRKNLDLLETNSKLNHKAFGKFDFSGILLFKTQVAHGNNYIARDNKKDSVVLVSKIMNPAVLTVGIGLDYKPDKNTSINFSPLSYKGTFVPDTANIDQTKYGIAKDKKSLNEPGVSFMISNIYKPFKSVTITNRLQLFTNYINNPQNIDIDWETIVVANLNWFTDVRFNTHLIFDDDTKTLDNDTQRKTARIQFKEMIGFSLAFRF
jgi:hypothetical protein